MKFLVALCVCVALVGVSAVRADSLLDQLLEPEVSEASSTESPIQLGNLKNLKKALILNPLSEPHTADRLAHLAGILSSEPDAARDATNGVQDPLDNQDPYSFEQNGGCSGKEPCNAKPLSEADIDEIISQPMRGLEKHLTRAETNPNEAMRAKILAEGGYSHGGSDMAKEAEPQNIEAAVEEKKEEVEGIAKELAKLEEKKDEAEKDAAEHPGSAHDEVAAVEEDIQKVEAKEEDAEKEVAEAETGKVSNEGIAEQKAGEEQEQEEAGEGAAAGTHGPEHQEIAALENLIKHAMKVSQAIPEKVARLEELKKKAQHVDEEHARHEAESTLKEHSALMSELANHIALLQKKLAELQAKRDELAASDSHLKSELHHNEELPTNHVEQQQQQR